MLIKETMSDIAKENTLLTQLIYKPEGLKYVIGKLKAKHFYVKENQVVYKAIVDVYGLEDKQPGLITEISQICLEKYHMDVTSRLDTVLIPTEVPSLDDNPSVMADALIDYACKREFKKQILESLDTFESCATLQDFLSLQRDLLAKLSTIQAKESDEYHVQDALDVAVNEVEKAAQLLEGTKETTDLYPTGISCLDNIIEGIRSKAFSIIGARPGVGKSALATQILLNCVENPKTKYPWIIFSLEMDNDQVMKRMFSGFIKDNFDKAIRDRTMQAYQWQELLSHVKTYLNHCDKQAPRVLLCDYPVSIEDVMVVTNQAIKKYGGVAGVMVDYVQMMTLPKGSERYKANAVAEVSKQLKHFAKGANICMLGLVQLNREVEHRKEGGPIASDIKDSGGLEQDADLIMLLERKDEGAKIYVVKNRWGESGMATCRFDGPSMRFLA